MNLAPTIGLPDEVPYEQLEFRSVDYKRDFGVKELTADAFAALAQRFKADKKLHNEFMVRSVGFHPSDPKEVLRAHAIFLDRGLAVQHSE